MHIKTLLKHPLTYITLFAFLLRILFFRVNETFISSDEVYLFQNSLKPLSFLLEITPAHYVAELFRFFNFNWGWVMLSFSTISVFILSILNIPLTEITINIPYVFLGAATMPVIYLLGKNLHNKKTGLIAALIFAVQPAHVSTSRSIGLVGVVVTFFFCLTLLLFFNYFKTKKWKKTAFLTLGLYFSTDHQFYLIIPLIIILGLLNNKKNSICVRFFSVLKDIISKELVFFFVPTGPIFASAAYLYSKDFVHNAYLMHIFQKSSYFGFFITTTFKELYYIFGPVFFTLFIVSITYAVIKVCFSASYKTPFFLLTWLLLSLIPWFFIVSRENTLTLAYLMHPISALIFLSAFFISELSHKKIAVTLLIVTISSTLLITSSVVYGVNILTQEKAQDFPIYELVDTPLGKAYTHFGTKGINTGIKTAGYYVREHTPLNATVFTNHEVFVTEYYLGRPSVGFLDLVTEDDILDNYEAQKKNTSIEYVYLEEKYHLLPNRMKQDGLIPIVQVHAGEKKLGTLYAKNAQVVVHLDVHDVDYLFNQKYGSITSLFIDYP